MDKEDHISYLVGEANMETCDSNVFLKDASKWVFSCRHGGHQTKVPSWKVLEWSKALVAQMEKVLTETAAP